MDAEVIQGPGPAIGERSGRAADGALVPGAALTGGQLIDAIGGGELSAELHVAAQDVAVAMEEISSLTGGAKVKGSVTIKLDITREDNLYKFAYDIKTTKPKLPKPKAVLWLDEHNRFTQFPPNQGQFFGVRPTPSEGGGAIRRV